MPFVKMMAEESGRARVRILDESTNRLVTHPSGRVRWFASEVAADKWIEAQQPQKRRITLNNFRPRNFAERNP